VAALGSDVVIIGGGLAGFSTAYYLAEMGIRSTVIERDGIASHASGFAYGGLGGGVTNGPQPNFPVIEYSMGLYPTLASALAEETNVDVQFQDRPLLRIALNDTEAIALSKDLEWQQTLSAYKVHWIDGEEARKLEPRISPATINALHVEGTFDIEPYRLTLALAQAAEKRGASIRSGDVTGVRHAAGKVTGIEMGNEHIACDTIVIAMGPWSAAAEPWLEITLPVAPLKGQILRLSAPGEPYNLSIGHLKNYAMTKPSDGLVWCGTTEEESGFDESRTTDARDRVIESTLRMLPALEEAELVLQTACLRPVLPDNTIVVGAVPSIEGAYIATGGGRQGIMMGPGMAKITADLIVHGKAALDVSPYSPGRFAG
jgi:glycine/D-amino acid oxidase-like deaminating enzyme